MTTKNITDIVAITLGTGVGSGIIINKKIFTGTNGIGGELGHTVIKVNGEKCTCGRNGCWEAYASATALIREAEKGGERKSRFVPCKACCGKTAVRQTAEFLLRRPKKGDEAGKKVIDKYILDVAEGIVNIINTFQPHAIVIGGGVSNAGGALLKPIEEYSKEHCYGGIFQTKISIAKLGNDAGIIGAAFFWVNKNLR
ncbi:MAG: ROK family protein [Clostridiales bacterium]|nr:MAG: ROK family protein [Clostridiales bacterium]